MRAIALVVALFVGAPPEQPGVNAAVQGAWHARGVRRDHLWLVFCGDGLYGINSKVGLQESTYRLNPDAGTIDIQRDDGLQLGIYWLVDDTLTMMLGDVNGPRPNTREARGYNKSSYVFEREG